MISAMDYDRVTGSPLEQDMSETVVEIASAPSENSLYLPELRDTGIGLHDEERIRAVDALNQLLVDAQALSSRPGAQNDLSDMISALDRRIRVLGGDPIRDMEDVSDLTLVSDVPPDTPAAASSADWRILLDGARQAARTALDEGDHATYHLLARTVIEPVETLIWQMTCVG
ncbi:MAG: hypothetical protein AAF311_07010 [Pseudomonadota bacterium]